MSTQLLIVIGTAFGLLMFIPAFWLLHESQRQQKFAARIRLITGKPIVPRHAPRWPALRGTATRIMSAVGQAILRSGIVPGQTQSELEETLDAAGLRGTQAVGVFIGAKIIMVLGMPVLTVLADQQLPLPPMLTLLLPVASAVIGMILPDQAIGWARSRYLRRLQQGLPDMLDMMVICAQAGLGIGPIIIRVATELRTSYPEICSELAKTATEMQVLSDSRVAIRNLGARTGLEPLKRLGITLTQAMQYGTPLSEALRVLAAELRQQMLNRFEARAARSPVLMTLPTALFILPCVFIIAGGPAIIQVMRMFKN